MTTRFRHIVPAALALALFAACGSDDGPNDSSAPEATIAEADAGGVADEATAGLEVIRVDLEAGTAVLSNTGDEPVDLSGHWVCNRPNYAELPAVVLASGESTEIGVAGATAEGGEVAIYSSDDFSSSADIVSYVQWGSGGGRSSVAEDAGIWSGPPVEVSSTVIELTGDPTSAAGWE